MKVLSSPRAFPGLGLVMRKPLGFARLSEALTGCINRRCSFAHLCHHGSRERRRQRRLYKLFTVVSVGDCKITSIRSVTQIIPCPFRTRNTSFLLLVCFLIYHAT